MTLIATILGAIVGAFVSYKFASQLAARAFAGQQTLAEKAFEEQQALAEKSFQRQQKQAEEMLERQMKMASEQAEEGVRRQSLGLARAAARSLFGSLLRQYTTIFAVERGLKEIEVGKGDDRRQVQEYVAYLVHMGSLALPSEVSDPFLNDRLEVSEAADIATYASLLEFLRIIAGLHEAGLGTAGGDAQLTRVIREVMSAILDLREAIRQLEQPIFQVTAWPENFFTSDEELSKRAPS